MSMADTNPDAVKLLSDDAVAEVAAIFPHAEYQPSLSPDEVDPCEFCKGTIDDHKANCVVPHVHALCATVRALRQQNRELKAIIDIGTSDDPGTALAKIHRIQDEATTALREQLAETQRAVDHWVIMYNKVSSDNTELVNQQGRPDVKRAAEIVSDAIRNSGFTDNKPSARSWAEGGESVVIAQLQSQLAQVTQERDDLRKEVEFLRKEA